MKRIWRRALKRRMSAAMYSRGGNIWRMVARPRARQQARLMAEHRANVAKRQAWARQISGMGVWALKWRKYIRASIRN